MNSDSIKNNIRKLRENSHYTQQDMADKLGISRTAYRQIESGETRLYSPHLDTIAALCGKSTEECILGYNPEDIDGNMLKEEEDFKKQILTLTDFYEEKIRNLREALEIKDEAIRTLKDINNRLSAQLDKNS